MLQNHSDLQSMASFFEEVILDNLAAIGSHIKTMKKMEKQYNCNIYSEFCEHNSQLEPFFDRCEQEYKERIQQ